MKNTNKQLEIWKDIAGYEGLYQVSDLGRVKSLDRICWNGKVNFVRKSKIIKDFKNKKGYHTVSLNKGKSPKSYYLHRLVAIAFIPNPENKPEVNHKKGNKSDNRVCAIEWSTYSENNQHSYDVGLKKKPKGILSLRAKFTESQVLAIRRLHRIYPNLNKAKLARRFNVCESAIHNIISRKNWNHI